MSDVSYAQAANDASRLAYTIYQDQRDAAYQRELNDKMMDREDSAIERRVNDAINAGINPYDAIGAGSGAGSSSGSGYKSSSLPEGLNFGSLLDYSISKERLKQEKANTKAAQNNARITGDNAILSSIGKTYALFGFQNETGFEPFEHNGHFGYTINGDAGDDSINTYKYYQRSPQYKQFMASYANFLNNSDMLRKENEWFNTNQILDAINSGTGSVGNVVGAFHGGASSYRDINVGSYYRNQNRDYSNQKLPAKIGF